MIGPVEARLDNLGACSTRKGTGAMQEYILKLHLHDPSIIRYRSCAASLVSIAGRRPRRSSACRSIRRTWYINAGTKNQALNRDKLSQRAQDNTKDNAQPTQVRRMKTERVTRMYSKSTTQHAV